jgi:fumarylpyruvate hydrolase
MATSSLHYEAELVVALGSSGKNIDPEQALEYVWGYAAGNDLTRRDLQAEAKELRRPWDMAKGFDQSAPIGLLHRVEDVGHRASGLIRLTVDGETKQSADLNEMIWPVQHIIAHLSNLVVLQPGDLIMTGTPAGVGALAPGQSCKVEIAGLSSVTTHIAPL